MQYSSFFILQFYEQDFSYFDVPGSLFSATSLGDVGFSGCQAELSFFGGPSGLEMSYYSRWLLRPFKVLVPDGTRDLMVGKCPPKHVY